ncbi:MAG: FAD-dependent oxidoreductase [Alphaproteobacteria bacterium]|nr:FAD-dependent oxidoreductase [Alphaproteobacteria bacterium]
MTGVDIIVVGAGNAATCAALSAVEHGAKVLMLETAPKESRGGNSAFTGGAFRFSYNGVDDLMQLCPSLADEDLDNIDFGTYTHEQYYDDVFRMTQYRSDADLVEVLVTSSFETAKWMTTHGVELIPSLGRQAFKVDGKFKFWGGLALRINGGGEQLVATLHEMAEKAGIRVVYEATAVDLLQDGDGGASGVRVRHGGKLHDLKAKAVVLACGGFESNQAMRARYLGPGWDLAKVRGTEFNNGEGLEMALRIGAMPYGHWSGCHAVAWDLNAPPYGDLAIGDQFQKHNVPFSIVVNANGERFRDEGEDFHSYCYARYGGEILQQPGMFAWQIFDQKVTHLLRSEYHIRRITKVEANTIEELAPKLDGVNAQNFIRTVKTFNAACRTDVPFDPNVHDGRCTEGLAINKSNWANPLDTPPFEAFAVTAGVTFTFGGIKVSTLAEVERHGKKKIPGLYAAGEMVGGLYFHNYASGTGLMAGATFGRVAGRQAAKFAKG